MFKQRCSTDVEALRSIIGPIEERIPKESLSKRMVDGRYIVRNNLERMGFKAVSGYVEYVDRDGNLIYAYGNENRELVEVYGLDLKEKLSPPPFNLHEAHQSGYGLIIGNIGSIKSIFDKKGNRLIKGGHNIFRVDNTITVTTGAAITEVVKFLPIDKCFEAPEMGGNIGVKTLYLAPKEEINYNLQ